MLDFGQMLWWHILLLPLVIGVLTIWHILLVRRRGVVPPIPLREKHPARCPRHCGAGNGHLQ